MPAVNRGTLSDMPGRFVISHSEMHESPTNRATRYHRELAKSIIMTNRSPDLPFSQSINPYRGCEHGCIYCYARPNHAYVDLSPGQDFESEIFCKDNAAEVLRDSLRKPGYRCQPIVLGTATDPYQPVERERRLTRELLQVLADCQHPFSLITKSTLVLRDLDLIAPMAQAGRAAVTVSVTTLDNRLKAQLEPRASGGKERLRAIRELSRAGVPVSVLVAPVIPFINDHELEDIVGQVAQAGAEHAGYVVLRLPHEVGPLWQQWLEEHYPDRAEKVMSVMRDLHGGAIYDSRWHKRQSGQGAWSHILRQRFESACRQAGLSAREALALDTEGFRPPGPHGQLALWDT
ncbi:PA0069 family radical SAM protein [Alcanivorax sp. DP30]|uniref:PA0069 family radical SAM protein n=1 Tax=Alcanivorax sp. DP30 TaxID=2606217 RepID=UPI00136D485A|nr:PA0069 family radical SAM protein [Alcanivorax sp. DP30]MZR61458.1 PA0069 family radical SAM protein [Alcanivorax sp. DP30]